MFNMHRVLGGVGASALTVALLAMPTAATAAGAPSVTGSTCRMTYLPVPVGTTGSRVSGGDSTGRYLVGEATVLDGTQWTFVGLEWVNGRLKVLDTSGLVPAGTQINVADVNDHGVIIGNRTSLAGQSEAWVYRDGRFSILPGLEPTDGTEAVAINARGDIVGTSQDNSPGGVYHAVIWPVRYPGTVRALTVSGQPSVWSTGVGINDDGTAIGTVGSDRTGHVWPARGQDWSLPAPAGTSGPSASAISGDWVAGTVMMPDPDGPWDSRGVVTRWNLRSGSAEVISTEYGAVTAVNRYGTVAATGGALLHLDGRVVPIGDGEAWPYVLTDRGLAAGGTRWVWLGSAVAWIGC